MTNRTIDGLRIERVARTISNSFSHLGIEVRTARSHPYAISFPGMMPCALASSTHVRRQIAPFISRASNGSYSPNQVYEVLRQ
jgi:hypothetical protein